MYPLDAVISLIAPLPASFTKMLPKASDATLSGFLNPLPTTCEISESARRQHFLHRVVARVRYPDISLRIHRQAVGRPAEVEAPRVPAGLRLRLCCRALSADAPSLEPRRFPAVPSCPPQMVQNLRPRCSTPGPSHPRPAAVPLPLKPSSTPLPQSGGVQLPTVDASPPPR